MSNAPAVAAERSPSLHLDMTLNEVLAVLGLRKRTSAKTLMPRKDILRGRKVVLAEATANDTWEWLREQGLLPWSVEEQQAAYEAYRAERLGL